MKKIISGIYSINNKINNKIYIGSSKNIINRWQKEHLPSLKKNKHYSKHLQRAWNKYGENNFEFKIIEECKKELLVEKEGYWIENYKSWDRKYGYNLNRFINNKTILHEETLKKMSQNKKEHWQLIKKNNYEGENLGFIKYKFTPEKIKEIKTLRENGLSCDEISKEIDISNTQYYRLNNKDGKYNSKNIKRKKYNVMNNEIKEKAIELRSKGKTWKEIANELGTSRGLFYIHNLALKQPNMVRKKMTDEILNIVIKLRKEGKLWDEISKEVGFCKNTLRKYYEPQN